MATIDTHATERRHITDRRANSSSAMSAVDWIAITLLIIGGVNWGLIGLFSFDLVAALFGAMSPVSRIVYTLVGISAIWSIFSCRKMAKNKV